ncbi:MAG: ABC transporter ATP-binding protein [Acidimicrobiia bacterium]|nr:ABC transporter ATP-binding protein [Acidimicrobiia bacterium]NNF08808.1 ABC transporter ATP-binding protein [Acidimicrobiia bacterium]NNL68916.1 ABC transporter ATP-binding protein [Acidimicrobiia bacterium]
MPEPAITFSRVGRRFGTIQAVQDLDLSIHAGAVAVLLGPNGAGKTTTVRLATGALQADQGTIKILGMDPRVDGNAIRRISGVVPPKAAFYDRLSGRENLRFAAELWELGDAAPIDEAADRFGIGHALEQEVGGYSTGMRTRLALARAILHDPTILLLDEPTAGLDPESARAVLDLIRDMAGQGRTIVMCTHLLHEAEGIADQVVLMNEGHAWVAGHPDRLAEQYWRDNRVYFDAQDRAVLQELSDLAGVESAVFNGFVTVELDSLDRLPDIVAHLVAQGARLTRVEPVQPTLEQLYFEMQRHRRREVPA